MRRFIRWLDAGLHLRWTIFICAVAAVSGGSLAMTTTAELKRLAGLGRGSNVGVMCVPPDCEAILALIAERDEAVALLRGNMMYPDDGKTARETLAFLSRIDSQKEPAG